MIIMKKKYSFLIITGICLVLVGLFLILILTRTNNITFLVMEKHYSLLYEEQPIIEIPIYSSHNNIDYFKKEQISKVTLFNNMDLFEAEIEEIKRTEETFKFQDKIYYKNVLTFKLPIETDQILNIDNANLKIEYINDEILTVKVGNISFFGENYPTNLKIHKVQGLVKDFGTYESLSGIILSISSLYDCQLTGIDFISPTILSNNDYIKVSDNLEYEHLTDPKVIFGNDFDNFKLSTNSFQNINLNKNIKKDVIIPLHYLEKEFVDSLGIIITYEVNGIVYKQVINPYKLFQTNKNEYFINKYAISTN